MARAKPAMPADGQRLPETARRRSVQHREEHRHAAGDERAAEAGAIVGDERDECGVDRVQFARA